MKNILIQQLHLAVSCLLLLFAQAWMSPSLAFADVVTFSQSGNALQITVNSPITFTASTNFSNGTFGGFVFEDVFNSPPRIGGSTGSPSLNPNAIVSIDGQTNTSSQIFLRGTASGTAGIIDPNDLGIGLFDYTSPWSLSTGEQFTLTPGIFLWDNFALNWPIPNPPTTVQFYGLGGQALSNPVALSVPEPTVLHLLAAGWAALTLRRRRRVNTV
jgi:hypothetical protein